MANAYRTAHNLRVTLGLLFFATCVAIAVILPVVLLLGKGSSSSSSSGDEGTDAQTVTTNTYSCKYRTHSQSSWGATCSSNNAACYRDNNFCTCFTKGVSIGCGPVGKWLKFTNTTAVDAFLPKSGPASVLSARLKNPASGDAGTDGVFSGHLLAAKLNAGFDVCSSSFSSCSTPTSRLCFKSSSSPCVGYRVYQVISAADYIIGNCGSNLCQTVAPTSLCNLSATQLSQCLEQFNQNYEGGTTDLGKMKVC
jgi:hypothetical protein